MFGYRHAFHAGNHADVIKHGVYAFVLNYLQQKPGALEIIDTHAGAGLYELDSAQAQQTQEWRQGIGTLPWPAEHWPQLLQPLAELLTHINPEQLLRYPGSPWVALHSLRPQDSLLLCEWQQAERRLLQEQCAHPGVRSVQQDGLELLSAIHAKDRVRQLLLVDPSYELKTDYQQLPQALAKAVKRSNTACIIIWYPVLSNRDCRPFVKALAQASGHNAKTLHLQHLPQPGAQGMQGSGLWVVNPPWVLAEAIDQAMPWLNQCMGAGIGKWSLETSP